MAFLLDSPRVVNCFEMLVKENPEYQKKRELAIKIESLSRERTLKVGVKTQFRFKVIDTATGLPKADLKDMGVLTFLAPGIWQKRDWAKSIGAGVYEIEIEPPQPGVYYIFFQCPSLGIQFRQLPHLTLQAEGTKPGAP